MLSVITEIPSDFKIGVATTINRGHTPAEVAKMCADKLVSVSDNAPPPIKEQANAFKKDILNVVEHYMRQAIKSDRVTLYNKFKEAGHEELAKAILGD
jgi:hypothetical protein|tara:strand:+ start:3028 stop:3321 length:294 start_codon:yes stop_codon:yes gene_type:complete